MHSSKNKKKIEASYNSAVLLLGIYPQRIKVSPSNIEILNITMFLVALFTIAKVLNQAKCSPT
jgi:hypothetical protein